MSRKKSTTQKEKEGTLKPSRNVVDKTAPLKRWIKAPIKLNDNAKVIYTAVLGMLIKNEVATALDTYSVAMFAFWLEVFENVSSNAKTDTRSKSKWIQEFKGGSTNITGYFTAIEKSDAKVQSYMKKLGLSIKDRQMITAFMENKGENEEDSYDMMLRKIAEAE
ncbi:MAG: hypothetical protein AB8G11_06285 [Saprospiraceae bacterium]